MNKAAIIGAGKTGRGFIGRLLAESDCEILFVDKNEQLVNRLNEAKAFSVHFFGNKRTPQRVSKFTAATWENADFSDIELIFVSVGGTNLNDVGNSLNKLINDGKTRFIITGENASHPSKTLKEAMPNVKANVSEATVFCTTVENGELDISSENYPYLQCDADLLCGYKPQIAGVKPVSGFGNFLNRKLFTYNAASCVIAYLGFVKGYTDYGEAANDEEILRLLDRNYAATNEVLCKEYGYTKKDQQEFAQLSKVKFCDRTIADTVARNAREPQRKLKDGERIIGPMKLLNRYGADTTVLIMTAAAAVLYEDKSDAVWSGMKAEKSCGEILCSLCGLEKDSDLYCAVLKQIELFEQYMKDKSQKSLPIFTK